MKKICLLFVFSLFFLAGFAEVSPSLHMVGPAFQDCDWNCPGSAFPMEQVEEGVFTWTGGIQAGPFKLLRYNRWGNNYVATTPDETIVLGQAHNLKYEESDNDGNDYKFVMAEKGLYTIVADTKNMTLTITKAERNDMLCHSSVDGKGKRIVNVESFSGKTSDTENPYNLIFGRDHIRAGEEGKADKWCCRDEQPWVVFSLSGIYSIDAFGFRDGHYHESDGKNLEGYQVYVSTTGTADGDWTKIIDETGVESLREKYKEFEPVEARYIKFVPVKHPEDGYIRIYGVDIYGTYVRPIDAGIVSTGKTIVDYSIARSMMNTPANIIDGNSVAPSNAVNEHDSDGHWTFNPSDQWVVVDLEQEYSVSKFVVCESKDWITGYKVLVSTTGTADQDWTVAFDGTNDAFVDSRESVRKEALLDQPVSARYVKLEIPRSCQNPNNDWWTRILEFEVHKAAAALSSDATLKSLSISEGAISPAFDADFTDYTLCVPYEITGVTVNAVPNDDKASVDVSGNTDLIVGENPVTVTVTAEDQSEKVYAITVTRSPVSAIGETEAATVKVYSQDGMICADLGETSSVRLYTLTGQLIRETICTGQYKEAVRSGAYILVAGGQSFKVIVK